MDRSAEISAFMEQTIDHAVKECAIYSKGLAVHEVTAANSLALCIFAFAAKMTRDVDLAEKMEAEFRRRIALLSEPAEAIQ